MIYSPSLKHQSLYKSATLSHARQVPHNITLDLVVWVFSVGVCVCFLRCFAQRHWLNQKKKMITRTFICSESVGKGSVRKRYLLLHPAAALDRDRLVRSVSDSGSGRKPSVSDTWRSFRFTATGRCSTLFRLQLKWIHCFSSWSYDTRRGNLF